MDSRFLSDDGEVCVCLCVLYGLVVLTDPDGNVDCTLKCPHASMDSEMPLKAIDFS